MAILTWAILTWQILRDSFTAAGSSTCMSSAVPDGAKPRPGNKPGVATRVGLHSYDRSYVQFYVGPSPSVGANVRRFTKYVFGVDYQLHVIATITKRFVSIYTNVWIMSIGH